MLVLDGLMIAWTSWVLSRNPATRALRSTVVVALTAWLGVLYGIFAIAQPLPPSLTSVAFYAIVLSGVAVIGALLFGTAHVRRRVLALDQRQLMLFQGVRVYFGAAFLIQGGLGILPATFGVIDGLSHITAGVLGLLAAMAVSASAMSTRRIWLANVFGLTDILLVATTLAFVLLPQIGPHHPMMYAVFLPAPLWLWAHVVSIAKLLGKTKEPGTDYESLRQTSASTDRGDSAVSVKH